MIHRLFDDAYAFCLVRNKWRPIECLIRYMLEIHGWQSHRDWQPTLNESAYMESISAREELDIFDLICRSR